MTHYICIGSCGASSEELGACDTSECSHQWEMMEKCSCTDGMHGKEEDVKPVKDANGNVLQDGDAVVTIKDLTLRGSSRVLKRGTKATIRLTDNPEEIDCKIDGTAIVLRVEFLKKL